MNYIDNGRVWVHSNIYDFHATIPDTINQTTLANISQYIAILDSYIEPLKSKANEFIRSANCSDYLELSRKLFGVGESDLTFSGCAKRTLRDQRFVRGLSHLKYDIGPVLAGASKEMQKILLKEIHKNSTSQFTKKEIQDLVANALYEEIVLKGRNKSKEITITMAQKAKIHKLGLSETLLPQGALRSKEGVIKEYAKKYTEDLLSKTGDRLASDIASIYLRTFEMRFMEERIPVTGISQEEISKQAQQLSIVVGERLSKEILASLANILGATGEAGLSAVHEYLDEGIQITVTGADSEEKVAEKMAQLLKTGSKEDYFLSGTHHKLTSSTQSQTDLILTAGHVSVKAQAKNSQLTAIRDALQLNDFNYEKTMWYTRKMEDDMLLTQLLEELTGTNNGHRPTLTKSDGEAIAYLLANAAWFNYAGSASDKHQKDKAKKTDSLGGIQNAIKIAENLISISIKDFIGVEILNNEVKPDASNIFYLVGNSVAIPVYMMLEDYKNQLLNVQQELFSLKYVMKPLSGIGISSAEKYRQQIIDSLGDILPDRNRIGMDTTVGFDMGDKVLSRLVGHVNFKFAVAQQLGKLSYKFY